MDPRKMMGFETPGDQRVPVSVRDWTAKKLVIWRAKVALEIAAREAVAIIARCRHEEKCPGKDSETDPCFAGCPDREIRMSALVILGSARSFAPIDASRPNQPYFAPSRERYSEVIGELGAAQIERDALRAMLRSMGVEPPAPPENEEPARLPREPLAPLSEEEVTLLLDPPQLEEQLEESTT